MSAIPVSPSPISNVLRFSTNVPVTVALKFANGRQVEGQFGDQIMYTLTDDRKMYLPLPVAGKIEQLGILPRQPFTICKAEVKAGNRKSIQWEVSPRLSNPPTVSAAPLNELERDIQASLDAIAAGKAASAPPPQPETPAPAAPTSNIMRACVLAAVEAAAEGERQADGLGMKGLEFSPEDVRAMAITIYIQQMGGRAR